MHLAIFWQLTNLYTISIYWATAVSVKDILNSQKHPIYDVYNWGQSWFSTRYLEKIVIPGVIYNHWEQTQSNPES